MPAAAPEKFDIGYDDRSHTRLSKDALIGDESEHWSRIVLARGCLWREQPDGLLLESFEVLAGGVRIDGRAATFAVMVEPGGVSIVTVVTGHVFVSRADADALDDADTLELEPMAAAAFAPSGELLDRITATSAELTSDPWVSENLRLLAQREVLAIIDEARRDIREIYSQYPPVGAPDTLIFPVIGALDALETDVSDRAGEAAEDIVRRARVAVDAMYDEAESALLFPSS